MRTSCFLVLWLCFTNGIFAQIRLQEKTGDQQFDAITSIQLSHYEKSIFDSALHYANAALYHAKGTGKKKLLATALYHKGKCLTFLNRYDSGRFYLDSALHEALLLKEPRLLIQCYNAFGVLSNLQSDNTRSVEYFLKSIAIIDSSGDESLKEFLPKLYSNIGYVFDMDKQYSKSIIYHRKAYEAKQYNTDTTQLVMIYQNFFLAHLNTGKVLLSKQYLDSAAMFNTNFQRSLREVYIRNNYGIYYETLKENEKALRWYLSAFHLCDSIQHQYFKSTIGISIAKLYFNSGNLTAAFNFSRESTATAARLKNYTDATEGFKLLAAIEKKQAHFNTAFQYLDSVNIYADSLNLQETRKNILLLDTKYQAGQREKEIADLKVANTEKELVAVKRNRLLLIGGISAIAIILVLGFMYRNSNNKKMVALKEQELQKEQIKFLEGQQQVISLQSMVNGQEAERTRIAKDLHDGLGGLFSTMKMYFSTLEHEQQVLKQNELFKKSNALIDTASEEVRRIAHNMMPEVLAKLGLIPAVQDMCSNISAGKLVQVKLQSYGMENRMQAATEIMLYRIVQELLSNIIKHAQASEAIVQFNRDSNRLTVTVEDNGIGFNMQEIDDKKHSGLEIIKSRVNYLHGTITIDAEEKVGTTILMEFLLKEEV